MTMKKGKNPNTSTNQIKKEKKKELPVKKAKLLETFKTQQCFAMNSPKHQNT